MALEIERKQPEGMNVRMQQGKAAYSHVVTVNGPGKTIYVAGQLARDSDGGATSASRSWPSPASWTSIRAAPVDAP